MFENKCKSLFLYVFVVKFMKFPVVYAIASIKIETKSDLLRKFNNVESFNY
jgi:hypothetical protein